MKYKNLMMGLAISGLFFFAGNALAQERTHEAAMSALGDFFADPAAMAGLASKDAGASQAAQTLLAFPPNIQRRLEKVVLMIMQESGANAVKHVDAANSSGPEGAFHSFSPAVQREIQEIARELESDPEFMKKIGVPR